MTPQKPAGPTQSELAILDVLWTRGPSTVREVHEQLDGETGYTTVLKLLQIMHEKGLVTRDDSNRAHIYRATRSQSETQGGLVRDLASRAFGGSASKLVMHALENQRTSPEELAQIRRLLDEMEGKDDA